MSEGQNLFVPLFTLIGIFLGWLLSFLTEFLKNILEKQKNNEVLKREKIEKAVILLYKLENQHFELYLNILNTIHNNNEIKLKPTEEYYFELKAVIYLYLPKLITEFTAVEKNVQANAGFLLPSKSSKLLENKKKAEKEVMEVFDSLHSSIDIMMSKLFVYMNKLIKEKPKS